MKPTSSRIEKIAVVLFGLALVGMGGSLRADDEISDKFSLKDRADGVLLHGLNSEVGNVVWQATKNVVVAGKAEGGYVAAKDALAFAGRVPLPPGAKTITAEADLHPVAGWPNGTWLAVGIGNPLLGPPAWGLGIFLYLTPDGSYFLCGDKEAADWKSTGIVPLKNGKLPDFNPDSPKPTHIKIEYKQAENKVSAWVNDVPVAEGVSTENKGFTVEPVFAGFSGFGQKADVSAVTNFTVRTSP